MADDELIIPIDKAFWPRGVMRGLTPLLRSLGDKHGNIVIAAVPSKHIMIKGPADRIEEVKAPLRELVEEHFPDAPVPEELGGEGEGEAQYTAEEIAQWEEEQAAAKRAAEEQKAAEAQKAADAKKAAGAKKATAPKASPKTKPSAAPAKPAAPAGPTIPGTEPSWFQKIGAIAETADSSTPAPVKKRVVELVAPAAAAKVTAAGGSSQAGKGRKQPRPAAMVAPDLLWECVRKNSSFLRKPTKELKRSHRLFSADPCNLLGVHSLKFSGVASEALNVRPVTNGNKQSIELVQSHAKASRHRRPKSAVVTSGLSKCPAKGMARLEKEVDGKFYRRDLLDLAKVKYTKVCQSFKTKKRIIKSRRAKD